MSEQVWYYSQHGERKGPVTLEVLQNALAHGKIDIATDLVWGPGLSEWVKVYEVPELQGMTEVPDTGAPTTPPPVTAPTPAADSSMSNIVPPSQVKAARAAENPYASPDSDNALQEAMAARHGGEYPGMGRLMYWIMPTVLSFVFSFGIGLAAGLFGQDEQLLILVMGAGVLVLCLILLFMTFSRLKNLGMSRWSIFWGLVPFMNIWLGFRLYACPAGYQDHKKLDGAGKVVVGLYVLLFFGYFTSVAFVGASYYKQAADKAAQQIEEQQVLQETSE